MVRHFIHGTIIAAEVTTHAAISDQQAEAMLVGTVATLLISAFALARDCSADLFATPKDSSIEAE